MISAACASGRRAEPPARLEVTALTSPNMSTDTHTMTAIEMMNDTNMTTDTDTHSHPAGLPARLGRPLTLAALLLCAWLVALMLSAAAQV